MAELQTQYRMYIDVKKENTGKIVAKQNDTKTRYLDITVTDNGVPIDLTGCEARIYGRKYDGTEFYNEGILQNAAEGNCLFEATTQMLALAAQDVHCEIVVFKDNVQILSTMPFIIHVVESLMGENAIESSNEYGALVVLYQNLYESIDLMTSMVQNFGEAGETAAAIPVSTFWQMMEALYLVNQKALEVGSVQAVLDLMQELIGTTVDTGGSETAGTLMAKENEAVKLLKALIIGRNSDFIDALNFKTYTKTRTTSSSSTILTFTDTVEGAKKVIGISINFDVAGSGTSAKGTLDSITVDGTTYLTNASFSFDNTPHILVRSRTTGEYRLLTSTEGYIPVAFECESSVSVTYTLSDGKNATHYLNILYEDLEVTA